MKYFVVIVILILFSSCALMVSGSKQIVFINSNVDSARVTINGEEVGTTPYMFKTKRREAFPEVQVSKKGYKTQTVHAKKKFNELVTLNFINPVGWVVDYGFGTNRRFAVDSAILVKK